MMITKDKKKTNKKDNDDDFDFDDDSNDGDDKTIAIMIIIIDSDVDDNKYKRIGYTAVPCLTITALALYTITIYRNHFKSVIASNREVGSKNNIDSYADIKNHPLNIHNPVAPQSTPHTLHSDTLTRTRVKQMTIHMDSAGHKLRRYIERM